MPKSIIIALAAMMAAGCTVTAGCGGGRAAAPAPSADDIRVQVASVGVDRESGADYVLLQDQNGKRGLPIMIGDSEAKAILLELHGLHPERPLTHDLLHDVIEKTGNHVERVVIADLRNDTYYASIYLNGARDPVDSRPSDAIALALRANAPIYVAQQLFTPEAAAGLEGTTRLPETSRALGITVQDLTPDLGAGFGALARSGVLVAAADGDAARDGIAPGELITRIGGKPVSSLRDFDQTTALLKPGQSIELQLMRGNTAQIVTLKVPAISGNR